MRLCVRVCICVFAPACVISELPSVPLVSVYSQHPLPLLLQLYDKFWCLPTLFFKIKLIILELLHVLQDSESASQLHTHTHTHTHTQSCWDFDRDCFKSKCQFGGRSTSLQSSIFWSMNLPYTFTFIYYVFSCFSKFYSFLCQGLTYLSIDLFLGFLNIIANGIIL